MHGKAHSHSSIFGMSWSPANVAIAILLTLLFLIFIFLFLTLTVQPLQGQTYSVLYNFTGGADGANPEAGLVMDAAGDLYGINMYGGSPNCTSVYGVIGCGTVFKLGRSSSGWFLVPLYQFQGGEDGNYPGANLTVGPDGALYGTTTQNSLGYRRSMASKSNDDGCGGYGCGTVFKIAPPTRQPPNIAAGWTFTLLHHFLGYPTDGNNPYHSPATFDGQGNIYLTTYMGGNVGPGGGTVTTLQPSDGGWTESILVNFPSSELDGHSPMSGVIIDASGNLDGTTFYDIRPYGGYGTVFQLIPSAGGWSGNLLYTFQGGSDGAYPIAGLVADRLGNLYGATAGGYPQPYPTIFMLTPSQGGWVFQVIYTFPSNAESPWATLAIDAAGNLYGTTYGDWPDAGHVFKLTHGSSGWTYTALHAFCSMQHCDDGAGVRSGVLVDAQGNIYGTAFDGGTYNYGVVYEITP